MELASEGMNDFCVFRGKTMLSSDRRSFAQDGVDPLLGLILVQFFRWFPPQEAEPV